MDIIIILKTIKCGILACYQSKAIGFLFIKYFFPIYLKQS